MFSFTRRVPAPCVAVLALLMAAGGAGAAGEPSSKSARAVNSGVFVTAQAGDPLVCCYKRQPRVGLLFFRAPRSQCMRSGGREAGMARCNRPNESQICCATPNGAVAMSRGQCRRAGRETSPARCRGFGGRLDGPRVCCATRNGFVTMSRRACAGAAGRVAPAVRCSPRALVCCRAAGPNGKMAYRLFTARACKSARGQVVGGRFCRNALRQRRR